MTQEDKAAARLLIENSLRVWRSQSREVKIRLLLQVYGLCEGAKATFIRGDQENYHGLPALPALCAYRLFIYIAEKEIPPRL